MKTYKPKTIVLLGETIDKEDYPVLYEWAKTHPDTLEDQLKSIAKAWHEDDIRSAMNAFEDDLEH